MNEILSRLELAKDAAFEAGRHALRYFQQAGVTVDRKADNSPVTIADREAEQILRRRIAAEYPDDAIIGEEFGEQPGESGFRWILDPIDGTKSFISGVPLYGTLVGIEHNEDSVVGVIFIPGLDEAVYAATGHGAWYVKGAGQPVPAQVSSQQRLADGVFLTSEVASFANRGAEQAYLRLQDAAYVTRTWGDCYGYLLVAVGRVAAMVDPEMHVWDAAALKPILEESGGTFTNWQGRPTIYGGEGVATNRHVLEEVLSITRDYPRD